MLIPEALREYKTRGKATYYFPFTRIVRKELKDKESFKHTHRSCIAWKYIESKRIVSYWELSPYKAKVFATMSRSKKSPS